MNERIKELARQAELTSLTTKGLEDIVDGCYIVSPNKLELFAELIVQECVNVMHDNELWNRHISHVLKEHFGVEE